MFITRDDFRIKAANFDLTESHNVVRMLAGFMMLPHAASKFAAGGLNPGTVAFFSKAGLQPAEFKRRSTVANAGPAGIRLGTA